MKKSIVTICLVIIALFSQGQKNIFLEITPMFENASLEMNQNYVAWNGKTFTLDHFDYYLSNLQLTYDGGQTLLIDSVFLMEPQSHTLFLGNHSINQIEKIDFVIGVPKPLNTESGVEAIDISLYPENHPLSFQSPSMYWGWSAGYMHMIIGGNADHNGDGSLESDFEIHSLGNSNQHSVELLNIIQSNVSSNQINVHVNCQVDRWINNISISTVGIIHGVDGVNAQILNNVVNENVFIQPANAGLNESKNNSTIYFNNEKNGLNITWENLSYLDMISIHDLNGRLIKNLKTKETSGKLYLDNLTHGYYNIHFYNENSILIGRINAVH